MLSNFETAKAEILKRAKEHHACADEYRKALKASNDEELLEVVKENLHWCSQRGIIDPELVKLFDSEKFMNSGIANSGKDNTGWSNTGDSNTGYSNTGDRNTGDSNTGYSNTGYSNTGDRNTGYSNTGDSNTGDRNTGDRNTGSWNTGDRNTGSWNTGDRNTGDRNTGDRNTGDRNTGSWNTGDRNTGSWNTGDRNTGYRNTGSWNTGDRNTGYSNTGDRNTGVFCTGEKYIKLFNKESNWTEKDFINSEAYSLLCQVDTKLWIPEENMTDEEKEKHIGYKNAEGFYRDIPFKQAFTDRWHNWDEKRRAAFTTLPNFDADIFEEITGVRVLGSGTL